MKDSSNNPLMVPGQTALKNVTNVVPERYPTVLSPESIIARGQAFADYIEQHKDGIIAVLTRYESFEVAEDEIGRTLDLLRSLNENEPYFVRAVRSVAAFLPRNQPLYALNCFAIVPSLMAEEAHVRAPQAMGEFFFDLCDLLKVEEFFPNVTVSRLDRETYLQERSAVKLNPTTGEKESASDVVIFTGTMENADAMRQEFSSEVLFIANGAGHNPIVVASDADVPAAVESAMKVQLYNQGQDCAAPNSILVHTAVYDAFMEVLTERLRTVKCGPYSDYHNHIGPISDRRATKGIQALLVDHAQWLHNEFGGEIHVQSAIVKPAIVEKPLSDGGNYIEAFAPVFFIQRYETDEQLAEYFEDARYPNNAMYVTVYGTSEYCSGLTSKQLHNGKVMHDNSTIIYNTDLHAPGVERGVEQYGGYGRGASCFSVHGKVTAFPTLPQRDIYEQLILPSLQPNFTSRGLAAEKAKQKAAKQLQLNIAVPKKEVLGTDSSWAEQYADLIIEEFPKQAVYVCGAGLTPGGMFTLSHLRDILTSHAVCKALKTKGKEAKLVVSFDDFDKLRKLPQGLDKSFAKYIGMPVYKVPDPLGEYDNYAHRFECECVRLLEQCGIDASFRYQRREYEQGRYVQAMLTALKEREVIGRIVADMRQKSQPDFDMESFVESYFPVKVYSRFTDEDNTEVLEFDGDKMLTYKCLDTGETEALDITNTDQVKLVWSVDWPMRWSAEEVCFEPGGKYLDIPFGSYETASAISQAVFKRPPPVFLGYDQIEVSDSGSGMKAATFPVKELTSIYELPIIEWLYDSRHPASLLRIQLGEEVLATYEAYDEAFPQPVLSLRKTVSLGQYSNWHYEKALAYRALDPENDESLTLCPERFSHAKRWAERYYSQAAINLRTFPDYEYMNELDDAGKRQIEELHTALVNGVEDLKTLLYDIPKQPGASKKENQQHQRAFFTNVYKLLIGRESGPRLNVYLELHNGERLQKLLDVSKVA